MAMDRSAFQTKLNLEILTMVPLSMVSTWSASQRIEMWGRWKAGQSLHAIGRAFGRDHVSIQFMLAQHGGIVPGARRRSLRTLTLAEREEISRGIAGGASLRQIAKGLQRVVSTGTEPRPQGFSLDVLVPRALQLPGPCRAQTSPNNHELEQYKSLLENDGSK
jgi:hypothetical protein